MTYTQAPATGFHDDIDEATYHGDRESLSVSGAKVILKAPALFRWQQDHPAYKRVFDYGHAAHAKVLGVGSEVRVIPEELLGANGATSTKAAKEFIAQARAEGATPIKPEEAEQIDAMADRLSEHTLAMRLLSEGRPEVSAYALDEPTGVVRRGRMDWLGAWILTDYKTAASADPDVFVKAAANYGYHMQAAWYLDLARDLDHPGKAFAFIVQEKDAPYLVTVIELPRELVDVGRRRNRAALERFRDCTETDLWPGYVPDDQFAQPTAPAWALREEM
jgi:hypothetical protein